MGPMSKILGYNVVAPLTAAPTAIGPSGSGIAANTAFTFTGVANATQYRIWIQDYTTGTGVPLFFTPAQAGCDVGTACSYTPATPLIPLHNYQWYALAINASGIMGPMSQILGYVTQ